MLWITLLASIAVPLLQNFSSEKVSDVEVQLDAPHTLQRGQLDTFREGNAALPSAYWGGGAAEQPSSSSALSFFLPLSLTFPFVLPPPAGSRSLLPPFYISRKAQHKEKKGRL